MHAGRSGVDVPAGQTWRRTGEDARAGEDKSPADNANPPEMRNGDPCRGSPLEERTGDPDREGTSPSVIEGAPEARRS